MGFNILKIIKTQSFKGARWQNRWIYKTYYIHLCNLHMIILARHGEPRKVK